MCYDVANLLSAAPSEVLQEVADRLMLAQLKKKIIAVMNVVEGVKTPNHFLMQSDVDQMRRISFR